MYTIHNYIYILYFPFEGCILYMHTILYMYTDKYSIYAFLSVAYCT